MRKGEKCLRIRSHSLAHRRCVPHDFHETRCTILVKFEFENCEYASGDRQTVGRNCIEHYYAV